GGGGAGGRDGHGACDQASYGRMVVLLAPTHGGHASHARIQGEPSMVPRQGASEQVLLPAGRHDEEMWRCSTRRAQLL
ncbi:unnamed protein product, partial [Urochloa humidicola]